MTDDNTLRPLSLHRGRSQRLLICALTLCGCGSDPGALFSAPAASVGLGSSGEQPIAGGGSSPDTGGGSGEGGTTLSGGGAGEALAGGGSSSGAPSAGAPAAGAASAGAASAGAPSNAGSGGGGMAGASNPNPSVCDGKTVKADALIADFEAGVLGWSGYLEGGPYAVLSAQPGAESTGHALRFVGAYATTSGFYHLLPCTDVSEFDGLQFWAKGKAGELVRFLAVVPGTDPAPIVGDCHEPPMKCSDHPGMQFKLSNEWKLYQAPWTELKQYGWGTKAGFYSVINAVLWINDGTVNNFDFSIDEVSLYKDATL